MSTNRIAWTLSTCLLACSPGPDGVGGALGPAGPPGQPGAIGPPGRDALPSFGVVLPLEGHAGREESVRVETLRLALDPGLTVDFGPGITVLERRLRGPSSVELRLSIAEDAPLGPRDVRVQAAAGSVIGRSAFTVVPTLEVWSSETNYPAGSYISFRLYDQDRVAFDRDTMSIEADGIGPYYCPGASGSYIYCGAFVEPVAAEGPVEFRVTQSLGGVVLDRFASGPTTARIQPRAPKVVTTTAASETVETPAQLNLYRTTIPGDFVGFVELSATADYENALWPWIVAWGPSGRREDYLGYTSVGGVLVGAPKIAKLQIPSSRGQETPLWFAAGDNGSHFGARYRFDLRVDRIPTAGAVERPLAHAGLPGQVLAECVPSGALVPCVVRGSISAAGELDVYELRGLSAPTKPFVIIKADLPVDVWIQDGAETVVSVARSALTADDGTPVALELHGDQLQSGLLGAAGVYDPKERWIIVVRGRGTRTGAYDLGLGANP